MKFLCAFLIFAIVVLILGLTSASASPLAQASKKLYNAQQQKDVTAWGAHATINWTDPPLNGGTFSDHRVAVIQLSPWHYGEIGWLKDSTGLHTFVAYDDGGGNTQQFFSVSPATHDYSLQYDPNTAQYWFYVDSVVVFNWPINFSSGGYVAAGGEVWDGVESMGWTRLSNLSYLVNQGGNNFVYVPWNGYQRYVVEFPYCNIGIDSNSFYDTENICYVFLPVILNSQ